MAKKNTKWVRDSNGDRYCTWLLIPVGGTDEDAIATVSPEWNPTRGTGIGKPDRWVVTERGTRWGTSYPSIRVATLAVDSHMERSNA